MVSKAGERKGNKHATNMTLAETDLLPKKNKVNDRVAKIANENASKDKQRKTKQITVCKKQSE